MLTSYLGTQGPRLVDSVLELVGTVCLGSQILFQGSVPSKAGPLGVNARSLMGESVPSPLGQTELYRDHQAAQPTLDWERPAYLPVH